MSIKLDGIGSGFNKAKIELNFQRIENYLNQIVLSRAATGVPGEATMYRDLDLNSFRILNGYIGETPLSDLGEKVKVIEDFIKNGAALYEGMLSFEEGNTLTRWNQALLWEATGDYYRWEGVFPKVVAPGSVPTPIANGAWVNIGNISTLEDSHRTKLLQIYFAELITGRVNGDAGGAQIDQARDPITGEMVYTVPYLIAQAINDLANAYDMAWPYDNGNPVAAGMTEFLVPFAVDAVRSMTMGGVMQYEGLNFKYDPTTRLVTLLNGATTLGGEVVVFHPSYREIGQILPNALQGFTFGKEVVLGSVNDHIYDPATKSWYFWTGDVPKTVSAGDKPEGAGWSLVGQVLTFQGVTSMLKSPTAVKGVYSTGKTLWRKVEQSNPATLEDFIVLSRTIDLSDFIADVTKVDLASEIQLAITVAERSARSLINTAGQLAVGSTCTISGSPVIEGLNLRPAKDLPALTPLLTVNSDSSHKVTLKDTTLFGDKQNQSSPGGAQDGGKHGIAFYGDCEVECHNLTATHFITDGLYYNPRLSSASPTKKKFFNTKLNNNGRQGMSLINYDGMFFYGIEACDTKGLLPEAGIDIEPNSVAEYLGDIYIEDLKTNRNGGRGVLVALKPGHAIGDIVIKRFESLDNGQSGTDYDSLRLTLVPNTGAATVKKVEMQDVNFNNRFSMNERLIAEELVITGGVLPKFVEVSAREIRVSDTKVVSGAPTFEWGIITNCRKARFNNIELGRVQHPSVSTSSGTSLRFNNTPDIVMRDCYADGAGYRLIRVLNTEGNYSKLIIDNLNVGDGDGFNSRIIEANNTKLTLSGSTIPTASEYEVYLQGTSGGVLLHNDFKATAPKLTLITAAFGNQNVRSSNSGVVTATTTDSTLITHGLLSTPTAVVITAGNAIAAGGGAYFDTVGNSTFVLRGTKVGGVYNWFAEWRNI